MTLIVIGITIRGTNDPNKCTITDVHHIDLKVYFEFVQIDLQGHTDKVPNPVLKSGLLKILESTVDWLQQIKPTDARSRRNSGW
jgi:hypothetical protein